MCHLHLNIHRVFQSYIIYPNSVAGHLTIFSYLVILCGYFYKWIVLKIQPYFFF